MLTVFFAVFAAVFLAEIVGDKLLYTTGVLAARYRTMPIMLGMALAFMLKMGVAVLVGEQIGKLPPILVASITMLSFIGVAIALWRKDVQRSTGQRDTGVSKAMMVSFAAIFFSEWGDVGQITAAAMAVAHPTVPWLVWFGAVSAMVTKGILAATLGAGIRQWVLDRVPPKIIRYVGVTALLVLGILSVVETLTEGHA
jgi:Ca2+/H+ antiporter, TMEM165/GDT1 family